jgi:hypothetical protein
MLTPGQVRTCAVTTLTLKKYRSHIGWKHYTKPGSYVLANDTLPARRKIPMRQLQGLSLTLTVKSLLIIAG